MPLDMTGSAAYDREVHWRRYLKTDGSIGVICVQDFDYHHYDTARFVDLVAFPTEDEAEFTPLTIEDVTTVAAQTPDDVVVAGQARRLVAAIHAHNRGAGSAW